MHTPIDHWMTDWLRTPLAQAPALDPAPIIQAMVPAITAYWQWHGSDGPLALRRFALRLARDPDDAEEALSETYLDVRERMTRCVARAAAGRSLPSFSTPEQVACYHRIQVRLRIQKRWRHVRPTVSTEDVVLSTPPHAERAATIQRAALPLHFALRWTLADCPTRIARKDTGWWWSMLRHGLDIEKQADLGGYRNDPTEITDRLRVRLALARGMRRWLVRWAQARPGWADLCVAVPAQAPDCQAVAAALPELRARIDAAIDGLHLAPEEAAGLRHVLVRGATVRTTLRRFSGRFPRTRMLELAESVGAALSLAEDRRAA